MLGGTRFRMSSNNLEKLNTERKKAGDKMAFKNINPKSHLATRQNVYDKLYADSAM